MAAITAEIVKQLRERTGSGMMDCKKALAETDGDMEKAIDYLREKGLAKAAKKAERTASDGRVFQSVSADGKLGVLVELNSETDFVAKTDEFNALGAAITAQVTAGNPADVAAVMEMSGDGRKIGDAVTETIAKLGENIVLKRFARFEASGSRVFQYVHNNFKVGVLLELTCDDAAAGKPEFEELGHMVCMQIAAMKPEYVSADEIPEDVKERERGVYRQQLLDEGKPADRLDKIIEGKLRKFGETVCLLEQEYIRDGDKRIKDVVKEAAKKLGSDISVRRFARFGIGE